MHTWLLERHLRLSFVDTLGSETLRKVCVTRVAVPNFLATFTMLLLQIDFRFSLTLLLGVTGLV